MTTKNINSKIYDYEDKDYGKHCQEECKDYL